MAIAHIHPRIRKALASAVANGGSRAVGMLVSLTMFPLVLSATGDLVFGVWASITSLFASLAFADFGLGNGMISPLAAAYGTRDAATARTVVLTSLWMLSVVSLLVVAATVIVVLSIQIRAPGGSDPNRDLPGLIAVVGLSFAASIPLSVISRIRIARQEAYINALWDIIGQCGILAGVVSAVLLDAGIVWIAAAVAFPPVISTVGHWTFWMLQGDADSPRLGWPTKPDPEIARQLVRTGSQFFIMQVAGAALVTADGFLAAHLLSYTSSTEVSIAQRVFSLPPLIAGLVLMPLWPAYAEAAANGDRHFVLRIFRWTLVASIIAACLVCAAGVLWGGWIFRLWLGPTATIPTDTTILASAVWSAFCIVGGPVAMLLNGLGRLGFQVITACALIVVVLPAKFIFGSHAGVSGLIWASVIAQAVCLFIPWLWYVPRVLRAIPTANGVPDSCK